MERDEGCGMGDAVVLGDAVQLNPAMYRQRTKARSKGAERYELEVREGSTRILG
jgi:hypothetical protein